jgi:imidazolonepropionase
VNVDFILLHAKELVTCAGAAPKAGLAQAEAVSIDDGAIASLDGRLVYAGASNALPPDITLQAGGRTVNLAGRRSVVPGFVDAHTHAAFAGDRRDELRRRLTGETYAQIAASGGGILSTVTATRTASETEIADATRSRLDEMLACGTTTCEIKSGYGLTTAAELKTLRALRQLSLTHPVSIVPTFLGAHEVPLEYRSSRRAYIDLVVGEMIPAVAQERLAEWCDVFCEQDVFTPEESHRVLDAGMRAGLKPRIHADELGSSGGSRVAADIGARSADHLVFISPPDIARLAAARVTATLLPIAAFYLKLGRFAPARALIEAGVPVALATDVNPGGGLSPSMPFAVALACFGMNMTFEEALVAATINAAWSVDRAAEAGSLSPGKLTDFVVVEGEAVNLLRVGATSIAAVVKRGKVVHGALEQEGRDEAVGNAAS